MRSLLHQPYLVWWHIAIVLLLSFYGRGSFRDYYFHFPFSFLKETTMYYSSLLILVKNQKDLFLSTCSLMKKQKHI